MVFEEIPYHVRRKLEQKRVEITDEFKFVLRCGACHKAWTPVTENRLRLPKGYWKCPNGCNELVGDRGDEKRLKVLIVDDDKGLCRSLAVIMRKAGYVVTDVYDGTSTLKAIEERRFDATVMDIQLPDINGVELLKQVRKRDPVIGALMMSGVATLEDAVESLNQGADAFILKPVDPGELLNRLGTLTGFKRLERELRQARAEYNELFKIINEYSMA